MLNVYEKCPIFEDSGYLMRPVEKDDAGELLEVYSDKNALPFFNSDNCDGDNFYYPTMDKMERAIDFWLQSYRTKWFVRWTIVDKSIPKASGTAEMFKRVSDDDFNGMGVLRLDVGSGYERSEVLQRLFALIIPPSFELFDCGTIITKVPIYAVERIDAARTSGFVRSESLLIGTNDRYAYNGYWTIKREL